MGSFSARAPSRLDPNNANRIVVDAGSNIYESLNAGASFNTLGGPGINSTLVALPEFQGAYQNDPGFAAASPAVPSDLPADTLDTSTMYATNGAEIAVTKNHGGTWVANRGPSSTNGAGITIGGNNLIISDIIVDPADRDTIFAVTSGNSGRRELDTSSRAPTPAKPGPTSPAARWARRRSAWTIAIDPRTNNLYVGTDTGVYELAGGVLTGDNNWVRFGATSRMSRSATSSSTSPPTSSPSPPMAAACTSFTWTTTSPRRAACGP